MITAFFYTLNPRCDLGLDVKDQISLLHHILLIVKTKGLQGIVGRNTIVLSKKKKKRYVEVPLTLKLALQHAYAKLAVKCRKSSIYCHIWISQIHYYKFDISFFFFLVISLSYSRSRISTFQPNFSPRSRTDFDYKKIVESIDDATPSYTSQPVHQFSYNLKSGRNLGEKLIWNVELRVRGCEREKREIWNL